MKIKKANKNMIDFMKDFQKKYCTEPQMILWLLFLTTIILSLSPFFKVGFTMADDLDYYLTTQQGNLMADALHYAKFSGRFYFLITKPLYGFPYIGDNFYVTKCIQYGMLLLSFILFAIVTKKIFKLKEFSLLVFLMLIIFLPLTRNYHFMPIISYPFFFSFSFCILLIGLLFLLKYKETNTYKYLVFSSIAGSITLLFYEAYLIFIVFIIGYIVIENGAKYGRKIFFQKNLYRKILPFFVSALLYIVIYFGYRMHIQTDDSFYSGSSFAKDFSISNFFKVLWNYNRMAFPTYVYHASRSIIEENSLLSTGHQNNFLYMLRYSGISIYINAFIQCFLFVFLSKKMTPNISWKKIGFGILILCILTFSVHIFLAFSEKYNTNPWNSFSSYVTTFYSYFCVTLLVALVIYTSIKACYKNKYLPNTVIGFFTLFIFYASIMVGYTNEHLSRGWQRSQNQFKVFDAMFKKGCLNQIPENAIIYAADLIKTNSSLGQGLYGQNFKWKDYILLKRNKEFNLYEYFSDFSDAIQKQQQPIAYYIAKYDAIKAQDVLMVLSKINHNSIDFENDETIFNEATANEATVYYYSPYKEFIFEFYIPECQQNSSFVLINNVEYKVHQGLNAIRINNMNRKEEISTFTLKSSEPFRAKSFLISTIGYLDTEYFQIN